MSHEYVITSKEVRPDFTARLFYDESPENPRKWGAQVTSIYFWDDKHEDLSDSRDIRSYQEALHDLYQKTYPELVDLCLEDEPPQEVLDLIEQTPYPGIVRWIRVLDTSMETSLVPVTYPDTEDPHIGGVAFISDDKLQEEQFHPRGGRYHHPKRPLGVGAVHQREHLLPRNPIGRRRGIPREHISPSPDRHQSRQDDPHGEHPHTQGEGPRRPPPRHGHIPRGQAARQHSQLGVTTPRYTAEQRQK